MSADYRNPERIISFLKSWLQEKFESAHVKGGIVGLSGGLDSAALAALLRHAFGADGVLAVIMPCHSQPEDEQDARLIARTLDIRTLKVDLTSAYDALRSEVEIAVGGLFPLPAANIKPRLRMTTLYSIAQQQNYLVCGASNKNELSYGYFTKHGDSGVDLLPLGDLLKGEVRALAERLGVPRRIIEKPPSAGLWAGQTDEDEMGITYDNMDRYLATGEGDPLLKKRMEDGSIRSEHKRHAPPIALIPR